MAVIGRRFSIASQHRGAGTFRLRKVTDSDWGPRVKSRVRYVRLVSWLLLLPLCLYIYFFRPDIIRNSLQNAASSSVVLGYLVYLFMGSVRGFTLIPSTHLVFLGIPFFRPLPLFVLSLTGIMISSASIYYFSESLQLDELFEQEHKKKIEKMKDLLQKNQMPIIIGWSFFPLVPTDLICYVCGVLKVNFFRFAIAVLIGEGSICAIYIFLGDAILRLLRLTS
jgi:uncharacterized membrane protein YdjX (TVP38/TMEM64 family)